MEWVKLPSDIKIGERLKEARLSAGLSQRRLAEQLGIALRSYQYYETDRNYPAIPYLIMLADILNVSTDYLLGRSDSPARV
jgi:transcriptional regulator with XRE-family HTH domain